MFAEIRAHLSRVKWRLMLPIALIGCLGWIALTFFRRTGPDATAVRVETISQSSTDRVAAAQTLDGEKARAYLQQTSDGQSLMQAVTAERFGLKLEERDPISVESGAGYLGMSHDQNLNAWFDDEGVTVRPTATQASWKLGFRLKAYGYEEKLIEAPPVVSRQVKGSRIEYERTADFGMQISDFGLTK